MANVVVEPIERTEDFSQVYYCVSEAFGRQTKDGLWIVTNPGWDTPEGQRTGAAQLVKRWKSMTTNKDGVPNTVFLKATVPDPKDKNTRLLAGFAIWQQCSVVPGWGNPPSDDLGDVLKSLDSTDARFAQQMYHSFMKRRIAVVAEKASMETPAVFSLDMCTVNPSFQRKGIAGRLTEWGLEEAKRRGGLECITEASSMGRRVYSRVGFEAEGEDFVYDVDAAFQGRSMPANIFMRTGTTYQ